MLAICVNSFGGPEVFTLTEVDRPIPAATQVLVQVTIAGVNYMDVYQRTGVTAVAPPYLAGVEGVGLIVEVGSEVTDLHEGQRVGWLSGGQGSFAVPAAPTTAERGTRQPTSCAEPDRSR
jgi:NADPH:quinone reductase